MSTREPALFSGTIRDNIAGWRDVTDEEVAAAAAAANATDFISRAPDGLATKVAFHGVAMDLRPAKFLQPVCTTRPGVLY